MGLEHHALPSHRIALETRKQQARGLPSDLVSLLGDRRQRDSQIRRVDDVVSKPTIAISSGTLRPCSSTADRTPTAIKSLYANTAVGRGPRTREGLRVASYAAWIETSVLTTTAGSNASPAANRPDRSPARRSRTGHTSRFDVTYPIERCPRPTRSSTAKRAPSALSVRTLSTSSPSTSQLVQDNGEWGAQRVERIVA